MIKKYVVWFLICVLTMECSFPNRATYSKIENLQQRLPTLVPIILKDFPDHHKDYFTPYQLEDSIKKLGFKSISAVVYQQTAPYPLIVDSSIEFTIKFKEMQSESNLGIFLHESVIYCFAKQKPIVIDTVCEQYIIKKISDSVYYKRNYDSIVTVH